MDEDFMSTQFLKKDCNLEDMIDEKFLKSLKNAFKDNDVSVISLAVLVENENDKELISFNYKNEKDKINNLALIDLSNPETVDKLKTIFK